MRGVDVGLEVGVAEATALRKAVMVFSTPTFGS